MTTLEEVGGEQDLWHVEVAPNDVRIVTLDQLDQAFQDGIVTETTRVWQDGMPCAVSLGELLGAGHDDEPISEPTHHVPYSPYEQAQYAAPSHYPAQPQYAAPARYAEQQYAAPARYAEQQYAAPARYAQQQFAAPVQYAPPTSPPPRAVVQESAWPPVIARGDAPSSTPVPPSMAPMALDVPEFDVVYPRSGGKGKFLLAAFVLAIGGAVAFQMQHGGFGFLTQTGPVAAAAVVQAPALPPQPASHAYDPGPPVKVSESKPPVTLTVRDEAKTDDKKAEDKTVDDKKLDAKKVMASGKKPKATSHARRSAPSSSKAPGSKFKFSKSGSKYDPLNESL
jgi:hypothetical protein